MKRTELFTKADCLADSSKQDWKGKTIILKPEALTESYRTVQNQVVVAFGGFGCDPTNSGKKVFVTFQDGETGTFRREDFLGILKEEPSKSKALQELLKEWQEKLNEDVEHDCIAEVTERLDAIENVIKGIELSIEAINKEELSNE